MESNSRRQALIGLGFGLGLIALFAAVKYWQITGAMSARAAQAPPATAVTTFTARSEVWPLTYSAVGSLSAVDGTTLSSETFGKVTRVLFQNGTMVSKGDILVELDTAVEEAQLRGAIAQADLASINFERAKKLREQNVNSAAERDQAGAQLRNATAAVDTLRAQIAQKRIIAPFAGLAGIRRVNEGQIVSIGTPVVSLYALDPLYLDFSLPQETVGTLRPGLAVRFEVDSLAAKTFTAEITALDPNVDPETRTVRVQATAKNPEGQLRPGMFADITVVRPEAERHITIPASCVQYAPYGNMVYIVQTLKDDSGREFLGVRQQVIKIVHRQGDLLAVEQGVNEGEQVVSSGAFKLRPNAPVIVNNQVQPQAERDPLPRDS